MGAREHFNDARMERLQDRLDKLEKRLGLLSSATSSSTSITVPGNNNEILTSDGAGGFGTLTPGATGTIALAVGGLWTVGAPGSSGQLIINSAGSLTGLAPGTTGTVPVVSGGVWTAGAPGSSGNIIVNSAGALVGLAPGATSNVATSTGAGWTSAAPAVPAPSAVGAILRGTFASRPSAGTAGRLYLCTDSTLTFYDDGAAWRPYFGSSPLTQVPLASAFTIYQTGTNTTLTDDKGALLGFMTKRVAAGEDKAVFVKDTFTTHTAYTVTIAIHVYERVQDSTIANPTLVAGSSVCGLCNFETTNKSNQFIWIFTNSSNAYGMQVGDSTSLTGGISSNFSQQANCLYGGPSLAWLRIVDDGSASPGTNAVKFYTSFDGMNWQKVWTKNRGNGTGHAAGVYPNAVGIIMNAPVNEAQAKIYSYEFTSP